MNKFLQGYRDAFPVTVTDAHRNLVHWRSNPIYQARNTDIIGAKEVPYTQYVPRTRRRVMVKEEIKTKSSREVTRALVATVVGPGTKATISSIDVANGDTDLLTPNAKQAPLLSADKIENKIESRGINTTITKTS